MILQPVKDAGTKMLTIVEVPSKKLDHGCRINYAGVRSLFGLELEGDHVPTVWPLQPRTLNPILLHASGFLILDLLVLGVQKLDFLFVVSDANGG